MSHHLDSTRLRDRPPMDVSADGTWGGEPTASTRVVVGVSAALIGISLLLMVLSAAGVADVLPVGLRTLIVSLVAVTLPGLPIAALLRLPRNGVFASVTISLSLAVTILLAQLDAVAGLRLQYAFQVAILAVSTAATVVLVRRALSGEADAGTRGPLSMAAVIDALARRKFVLAALIAAAVLFLSAVSRMRPEAAEQYGLIQVLGVDFFIGLALLAAVMAVEYRRTTIDPTMLAAVNVLLIVYATMPVAWSERTPPFPTAFVHRFITNWIASIERVPPPVDARMSWAGFFSAGAHLMKVGGLPDSEAFLVSASLVFSILMMFPVYAIGMAIAGNPRIAWLGVTIYILFNWYQQDYFAPQAVAMQLYATIVAVLLWQLRSSSVPPLRGGRLRRMFTAWNRVPGLVAGRDSRWTNSVELILLVILLALVVSHQLTPLVAIIALTLFAVTGLTRYKLLWLAALLIFFAWFKYGAFGYWHGHLEEILAEIGGIDGNLNASVSGRIPGDPAHGRMQYLRIAASVLLFFAALLGWYRLPRDKVWPVLGLLVVAPFVLVLLQSYGGEVAIRCFLYASPVMAPLTATLLARVLTRPQPRAQWIAVCGTFLAFLCAALWITTNRGLNTAFELTTPEGLAVAKQMQDKTDPSKIAYWGQGSAFSMPKEFDFEDRCKLDIQALATCTSDADIWYLVDTKQDEKYLQYKYGMDAAELRSVVDGLISEKGWVKMFEGDQVQVLRRSTAPVVKLEVPS